jgi:hypothetical protein
MTLHTPGTAVVPVTSAAATAAVASASTAATRVIPRLGLVDAERPAVHLVPVQSLDGFVRCCVTHFHKAETPEFAGFSVCDHGNRIDRSISRKQIPHLVFSGPKGQIPDIDPFGHVGLPPGDGNPAALWKGEQSTNKATSSIGALCTSRGRLSIYNYVC